MGCERPKNVNELMIEIDEELIKWKKEHAGKPEGSLTDDLFRLSALNLRRLHSFEDIAMSGMYTAGDKAEQLQGSMRFLMAWLVVISTCFGGLLLFVIYQMAKQGG